ncbi:MAG: T9SS type A sorting domain-containing protein [Ferruginibacter sp.]
MKSLTTALFLYLTVFAQQGIMALPKLNSNTTATAIIYLDFDGHYVNSPFWNGGTAFYAQPSVFTDLQITEIFNRVAEDYRPFDVNISTDSAKFLESPLNKRIRVIVTPTSGWFTGVGGVSYVGSFVWGDDTPCFVFSDRLGPNSPKMVGECCSHESGHTLGLSHQSKYDGACGLVEVYNSGQGTGEPAWAPIMGNSYYRNMTGWNNGKTPYGCTNEQDNLQLISTLNGFGYRVDDYGDQLNATATVLNAAGFKQNGIISTTTDVDAFTFTLTQNVTFKLSAIPYSVGGNNDAANLDIQVSIFNQSGTLIKIYNPENILGVNVDTILNSGKYYIKVDGTGNSNISDYGSLGSYSITGVFGGVLPIKKLELNGMTNGANHAIRWAVETTEPLLTLELEKSVNGNQFNLLQNITNSNQFIYTPTENCTLFYRLKATEQNGKISYSSIIALQANVKTAKAFTVSTFTQNDITVMAPASFQYTICSINGAVVSRGTGNQGLNKIPASAFNNGIYVITLSDKNNKQVEKIVKN